jgi:hypothetical protein
MKIIWPNNKSFAFTIIDDTDDATVENIKPIYDLLHDLKLITTKTVWVYPSRDRFSGQCLQDLDYLNFIVDLKNKGFEIALHGLGSGDFTRDEILSGLSFYKKVVGENPRIHTNHAQNSHNLYHGNQAGSKALQKYATWRNPKDSYFGQDPNSKFFWGDWVKNNIDFIRGKVFKEINTLKVNPRMPYIDHEKSKYSNYWFNSSDGSDVNVFNELISEINVNRLEKEGGLCIVYTHFASGFYKNQNINSEFESNIRYLASKNGWFVPASVILDYLIKQKGISNPTQFYHFIMDLKEILKQKIRRF